MTFRPLRGVRRATGFALAALTCGPACSLPPKTGPAASGAERPSSESPRDPLPKDATVDAVEMAALAPDAGALLRGMADAAPAVETSPPSWAIETPPSATRGGETRVFREIFAGMLNYPPARLTWTLWRERGHPRLAVSCERGLRSRVPQRGLSIDGTERDASLWGPPERATFDPIAGTIDAGICDTGIGAIDGGTIGARVASDAGATIDASEGTVRLRRTTPRSPDALPCAALPDELTLQCATANVSVLSPGAVLVVGRGPHRGDDSRPWRWEPAARTRVAALSCHFVEPAFEATNAPRRLDAEVGRTPLVFVPPQAAALGVEWVYQNDDMVVQQGAHRWMSGTSAATPAPVRRAP